MPRYLSPYPQLKDLAQLATAVEDVQSQAPITAEIQRLIQPGVTLAAHHQGPAANWTTALRHQIQRG